DERSSFRTQAAVRDLAMHGGEGIRGFDERAIETAIAGPFADATGPYLIAAFADRGFSHPGAERLPERATLRPAADGRWTSSDGAIGIKFGSVGASLKLEPPFRV